MRVRGSRAHDNLSGGDGRMREEKGGSISRRVVAEGMSCWGGENRGKSKYFRPGSDC